MAPLRVIIIGGGLAGACLGNGLINHGGDDVQVTVYERDKEGDDRSGYQIRLGEFAIAGFRACLTKDQFQSILPLFGRSGGVVSSAPCIYHPSTLRVLVDLGKLPTFTKSAPIARIRLREALQGPLRDHKVIRYNKRFLRYESLDGAKKGSSQVRAHFADGTFEDCDILISAEGSGSRINKQIGLNNIMDDGNEGFGWLFGKCHLPWEVLKTLPPQLTGRGAIYTTNSKAIIYSAVYLPPDLRADPSKAQAADRPADYDEAAASLFLAVGWLQGVTTGDLLAVEDKKSLLRKKIIEAGFHKNFVHIVDALDNESLIVAPARTAKSDTPVDWRRRILADSAKTVDRDIANPRVWLIGDSIHPMPPTRGMGANNAIRDTADSLTPLLDIVKQHKATGAVPDTEVAKKLETYETAMIPRAMGWVKKSHDQQLPDLETTKSKILFSVVRVVLFFVGGVVNVLRAFGWKPKDRAPELA